MNKLIALAAAAATLLGMSLPPARAAYTILPPGAVVAGKSIADWTADWWTWGLQAPEISSPLTDPTGGFAHVNLKNPLIYQTGPKTSAKSGCSRSIWEKRCISGPSQSSRIVGSRS